MAPPKKTLYDILGVSQDANAIDIGLAYEAGQARLQGGAPAPAPAPPKVKSAAEILADATTSGGPLLAYEMSGLATPIGYAMAIEPGMMVTTCHGIPAGNKLVVRVGIETHPAELVVTDEKLGLCKLALAGFGARPLTIAADEPKVGDKAYVVVPGKSPGETALAETTVKAIRTAPQDKVLELAMALPPGGDGGGVFDAQGRLIGIAGSLAKPSTNAAGAVPVSAFAEMRSRGVATQ